MSNDIISIKDTNGEENYLFMIVGDTNSRTGILPDYVSFDNSMLLDNLLPDEYSIDQYMPRSNQDKQVNQNGRLLLDFQDGIK